MLISIKNNRYRLCVLGAVGLIAACTSFKRHNTNVYPEPDLNHGLIYFYREFDSDAAQIKFDVEENGRVIGKLANGTYFFHQARPGRQYYFISPGSEAEERGEGQFVHVEPGKKYFLRAIAEPAIPTARARVFLTFESQAMPVLEELTYATLESSL